MSKIRWIWSVQLYTWEFVDFSFRPKVVAAMLLLKWFVWFSVCGCMVKCTGKGSVLQDVCVFEKHCLCLYRSIFLVDTAMVLLFHYIESIVVASTCHSWQSSLQFKLSLTLSLMFQTFKAFRESAISHKSVAILSLIKVSLFHFW